MRAGIITGSGAFGLPSSDSIYGNGCLSLMVKLLASVAAMLSVAAASSRPSESFGAQRASDATQSVAVTGAPSCHARPSRRVNAQVRPSGDVVKRSTICGWMVPARSIANSVSKTW